MGDIQVSNVLILREFPDTFLDELPGVPLVREVEVIIDVLPCTFPIAQSSYRMTLVKLAELKIQL